MILLKSHSNNTLKCRIISIEVSLDWLLKKVDLMKKIIKLKENRDNQSKFIE